MKGSTILITVALVAVVSASIFFGVSGYLAQKHAGHDCSSHLEKGEHGHEGHDGHEGHGHDCDESHGEHKGHEADKHAGHQHDGVDCDGSHGKGHEANVDSLGNPIKKEIKKEATHQHGGVDCDGNHGTDSKKTEEPKKEENSHEGHGHSCINTNVCIG